MSIFLFKQSLSCRVIMKEDRAITYLVFYFIFFFLLSTKTVAQEFQKKDSAFCCSTNRSKFEIGGEYLTPTRFSNEIKTVSIHGFYWKKYFKNSSIMISAGITGTYAWGKSTQWEPASDSTVKAIDYKTSAFGIGPVFQIDPTIIKTKRFQLNVEASGGVILYNRRFPYGGDIYNFMFRAGPSLIYKFNHNNSVKIGYRWMHVSNGQGMGNHNPFYEAQGINVSFIINK